MCTVINKRTYDAMPVHLKPRLEACAVTLRGIGSSPTTTFGYALFPISLHGRVLYTVCIVADIRENCILGQNFFADHNIDIDNKNGNLRLGALTVVLTHDRKETARKLVTCQSITIPPRSESLVSLRPAARSQETNGCCVVEGLTKLTPTCGLVVGRCLLNTEEPMAAPILNVTDTPITLRAGYPTALATRARFVDEPKPTKLSLIHI